MRHGALERHQTAMDTGRGHQILLRQNQSPLVAEPYPDGENHPQQMAESRIHGQIRPLSDRRWYPARRYYYTSYKVANLPIEFSTSIPRTQLRPGYGEGFLGAPLQRVPSRERPAPRGQGDPRGTSRTHRQHNPGGAHHV